MKNTDPKTFEIKKELVIKDYESLFTVYGRETNIVFSFRAWTITLLSAYLGFIIATDLTKASTILYYIPILILSIFMILEVAERSVMRNLLIDLRKLEMIFMEKDYKKLEKKIMKYEFRDLRDTKIDIWLKIKSFFRAFLSLQVISWYPSLTIITLYLTKIIIEMKNAA